MRHACLIDEIERDTLAVPNGYRLPIGPAAAVDAPRVGHHAAGQREAVDAIEFALRQRRGGA